MRSMLKLSIAPLFATLALVSFACGDDTATGGGGSGSGGTPASGGGGQGAGAGPQGGNGAGTTNGGSGGEGEGGAIGNGGNGGQGEGGNGGSGGNGNGGEGGGAADSEQAFFFGDFATDGKNDVATVSFPGGTPSVLALNGFATGDDLRSIAVSPDGSLLAIAGQDQPGGNWTLNLYNADGSGNAATLVTAASDTVEIEQLSFSKDGAWIAYRSDATFDGGNELWVVPTAGGVPKRVSQAMTTSDNDVSSYAWRADSMAGSEHLAFQADPVTNNAFGLFTVDVMALSPVPVAIVPEATASQAVAQGVPAFDSQGRVYFRSDFEVDNVFRLYRANIDGTMRAQVAGTSLTNGVGEASTGAVGITPDGSTLVFGADSPTQNLYQLYALDLSGNTAAAITDVAAGLSPTSSTGPDFAPAIQFLSLIHI